LIRGSAAAVLERAEGAPLFRSCIAARFHFCRVGNADGGLKTDNAVVILPGLGQRYFLFLDCSDEVSPQMTGAERCGALAG
jgi:hypothetical protein